jgi:hypothetical protein
MAVIYEKRTPFNLFDHMNEFKEANIKNIKHKISRIKEFNLKTSQLEPKKQLSDFPILCKTPKALVLKRNSTEFKTVLQSFSNKKVPEINFTLVYDEVVDYLSNKNKLKFETLKNTTRNYVLTEEEEDFFAMDRLLSPKNQSMTNSNKKEEMKLMRNMKMKKHKKNQNSRSQSPSAVILYNEEVYNKNY